jgi:hypothetical protein
MQGLAPASARATLGQRSSRKTPSEVRPSLACIGALARLAAVWPQRLLAVNVSSGCTFRGCAVCCGWERRASIEVVSPYDAVTQAQLRSDSPPGRLESGRPAAVGTFPLEAAPALQQGAGGSLSPWSLSWPNGSAWMRATACPLCLSTGSWWRAAAVCSEPLPDGRHVVCPPAGGGALVAGPARGAVLADAMGLGKTLSALAAARAMVRLGRLPHPGDCSGRVCMAIGSSEAARSRPAAGAAQLGAPAG